MRQGVTARDPRGDALIEAAQQLGRTRSQIVDEAGALFLKAIVEVRRGRRVVTSDPAVTSPACDISTRSSTMLERAAQRTSIGVSADAFGQVADLRDSPPEPTPRLTRALARPRR